MNDLQVLEHAFLLWQDDTILDFGPEDSDTIHRFTAQHPGLECWDAAGGAVFPSWCDAHTHVVFAGSREQEFVDRINGLTYQEIAVRGGGILNSARKLREATEDDLYEQAKSRLQEMMRMGTGAVEIKSGYGLDLESEMKMLRVIRQLAATLPLTIKSTFLGAHAVPAEFAGRKSEYVNALINEWIPAIAKEKLADYCDVFCENGYFTAEDTTAILQAAVKHGMIPKVHAEQLSHSGGIQAGVACGAISVDHLEFISEEDMKILASSSTMPVILPGAQLFLGLPSPPVRTMINHGLPVALSTDFNPGSSPTGNMNQMVSLACILYKMTPAEAIMASTTNSAYAMGISKTHGSIAKGKQANFFLTRPIPSPAFLPYYFGSVLIDKVILAGRVQS